MLFDLIEPCDGQCSFRDLVSAREVARLLREGLDLPAILATAEQVARRSPGRAEHPLTRLKLVGDGSGQLARWIDGALGELDGQMRLPLPRTDNPSVDELFENAEEAEEAGDLAAAEALYRRCIALDRNDPIALFNLANVLCAQHRGAAAKLYLQLAVSLDPGLAEAWYNLALLQEAEGDKRAARESFERAIEGDPDYADPLYNLAHLEFEAGAFAQGPRPVAALSDPRPGQRMEPQGAPRTGAVPAPVAMDLRAARTRSGQAQSRRVTRPSAAGAMVPAASMWSITWRAISEPALASMIRGLSMSMA